MITTLASIERGIEYVRVLQLNAVRLRELSKMTACLLQHRLGIIDTNEFATITGGLPCHRQERRAPGAPQIINPRTGPGVLRGKCAGHADYRGVARYRAIDHVRERPRRPTRQNGRVPGQTRERRTGHHAPLTARQMRVHQFPTNCCRRLAETRAG